MANHADRGVKGDKGVKRNSEGGVRGESERERERERARARARAREREGERKHDLPVQTATALSDCHCTALSTCRALSDCQSQAAHAPPDGTCTVRLHCQTVMTCHADREVKHCQTKPLPEKAQKERLRKTVCLCTARLHNVRQNMH